MNCVDVKPDYKDSVCFLSVFCDVTSYCSVCFSSCEKSTKLFCFKLICSVIIPSSSWPLSSVLSTVSAPRVFSPESSVFSTSSASRHERIELNRKWLRAIDSIPDRKSVYSVRKEMLSQVDKFLLIKKTSLYISQTKWHFLLNRTVCAGRGFVTGKILNLRREETINCLNGDRVEEPFRKRLCIKTSRGWVHSTGRGETGRV